jgi:hypothetical protein
VSLMNYPEDDIKIEADEVLCELGDVWATWLAC